MSKPTKSVKVVVAENRSEEEPCEAGTPGCCVDHMRSDREANCDTW